jgi:hypothetical protein
MHTYLMFTIFPPIEHAYLPGMPTCLLSLPAARIPNEYTYLPYVYHIPWDAYLLGMHICLSLPAARMPTYDVAHAG